MSSKNVYIIIVCGIILTAFQFQHTPLGPHGGRVKEAGIFNIETKNTVTDLYAFLLDKKLKPIANKGISCSGKFILTDSTSVIIPLRPLGEDGFSMSLGSLRYASCRISFNVSGKIYSTLFENENLIATKKQ